MGMHCLTLKKVDTTVNKDERKDSKISRRKNLFVSSGPRGDYS